VKDNFPPVTEGLQWLQQPFMFALTKKHFRKQHELTGISTDTGLKYT
jgi:hypothetical protein